MFCFVIGQWELEQNSTTSGLESVSGQMPLDEPVSARANVFDHAHIDKIEDFLVFREPLEPLQLAGFALSTIEAIRSNVLEDCCLEEFAAICTRWYRISQK